MSELTLGQLCQSTPGPFASAAQAWKGLAEELDNAAEQFIRGTRDLDDAWPEGPATRAAHERVATMRAEVSNAYNPARRIYQALERHAGGMAELRGQAEAVIAAARAAGLTVDPAAGTVTAPSSMSAAGSPESTAYLVNGYVGELTTVLERARSLDDGTTGVLAANLPDAATGFGALSLPPITRQDLENQRGRTPAEVNAWWNSLTPAQQEQAIRENADLVGWLDGVPATDRDTANRIRLDNDKLALQARENELRARLAYLMANPNAPQEVPYQTPREIAWLNAELAKIDQQQANLGKVETALAGLGDKGLLLGIDPAGDGKAIVAVGNPDTSRHTAVWVPGLNTDLGNVRGDVRRVRYLQERADGLTPEPDDVATVMWLGYDAPELSGSNTNLSVVKSERAEQGGAALDGFVTGLRATHEGGPYHVTAVGHSYGSTVVAEAALRGDGLAVDDIVTAGSPGMHTEHASDFKNINARHVWAGSAADDPVSDTAGHSSAVGITTAPGIAGDAAAGVIWAYERAHGESPHREEFGANRYVVDTVGHNDYWDADSTSLGNQANIVVGNYDEVGLVHGAAPTTSADDPPPYHPPGVVPTPTAPVTPPPAVPPTDPSPAPGPSAGPPPR
ncbi:MAG TPA: alpha/beta hydrolase [Pilimelia sp.]|nr:alpha/beta hydrolase [Pilimelia sp.]